MPSDDTDVPAVELRGIRKRFGDVVANDGIDLTVEPGSVHALLGENGSGKTTLMSILYGLYDQNAGTIRVDGAECAFDSPRDAIAAGVGMIHQHFQLVEPMTVLQNIVLGHEPTAGTRVDTARARDEITAICDRYEFAVDEHLDTRVAELDTGVRQRVEIVKSLYRGAEVLILDEPTAVLTPTEVDQLFELLAELRDRGRALIFITHKLEEAMGIADKITVLRDGARVGTVPAAATTKADLAEMMVGREVLFEYDRQASTAGEPVLTVDGVTVRGEQTTQPVRDVSFAVRAGEIFAVAGVQGNGQSALIDAITGAQTVHQVRREIHHLSRDQVTDVLEVLGFHEELKKGRSKRDYDAVERTVREVTR